MLYVLLVVKIKRLIIFTISRKESHVRCLFGSKHIRFKTIFVPDVIVDIFPTEKIRKRTQNSRVVLSFFAKFCVEPKFTDCTVRGLFHIQFT